MFRNDVGNRSLLCVGADSEDPATCANAGEYSGHCVVVDFSHRLSLSAFVIGSAIIFVATTYVGYCLWGICEENLDSVCAPQ